MSKSRNVLVVGAGLGGLATALVLANDGHCVRVLEAAKTFGEVCYLIQSRSKSNTFMFTGWCRHFTATKLHPAAPSLGG